ncbi:MAG: sulfotransferase domain-containing protein, partial [DPANN group archaeon]|nr:sulfotransferase domain-containing protein [DPANN group archaeon]
SVVIYGANQHTVEMLSLIKDVPKPKIISIIDYNPKINSISNIPIIKPKDKFLSEVDLIIISTDRNEELLFKNAKSLVKETKIPIIRIYHDYLVNYFAKTFLVNSHPITPKTSYIMCTVRRSGSVVLESLLKSTNLVGNPKWHFGKLYKLTKNLQLETDYLDIINKIITLSSSKNKIFGTKMHWATYNQFETAVTNTNKFGPLKGDRLVRSVFPNVHYIFLKRNNNVKQAISLFKAQKTDIWAKTKEHDSHDLTLSYNFDGILQALKSIKYEEKSWTNFFRENDIKPLTLIYEDFIKDFDKTIITIFKFLDVKVPTNFSLPKPKYKKLADNLSEEWYVIFSKDYAKFCKK